jgi:hypothetical protein
MRIWSVGNPYDYQYAQAAELIPYEGDTYCPVCGAWLALREAPLQMYWDPGSDLVGDFVWPPSVRGAVVVDRMLPVMAQFADFRPRRVDVVENPDRRIPKQAPRVNLPYAGPPLFEISVDFLVSLDRDRSTARLEQTCGTCSIYQWKLSGVSRQEVVWDKAALKGKRVLVPREPGRGIYVREADLGGFGIFGIREFRGASMMCTDRVREYILAQSYTNVEFLEMGETIP